MSSAARNAWRPSRSSTSQATIEVDGRVPDREPAEVQDSSQPAIAHQQVLGEKVAVKPGRRRGHVPLSGQRRLPDVDRPGQIQVEAGDPPAASTALAEVLVQHSQRATAVPGQGGVIPGSHRHRDGTHLRDEARQVLGQGPRRTLRSAIPGNRRGAPLDPARHRPLLDVAEARFPDRDRLGNLHADPARDQRPPARLLLDRGRTARLARQANQQIVTEPEQGVRGTRGRQRARRATPRTAARTAQEPTHQRNVDRQLVSMQRHSCQPSQALPRRHRPLKARPPQLILPDEAMPDTGARLCRTGASRLLGR